MSEIRRIATMEELEELFEASRRAPVWVFKHSLVCPVSSEAWREFRAFTESPVAGDVDFALIEIQNARPVSQALADRTGVRHESPQAILLRDAKPVWHASHWRINSAALSSAAGSV